MAVEDAWGSAGDFYPGEGESCDGCPALKGELCIRWGSGRMPFTPSCVNRER